jgi:hypothetical protein
VPTGTLAPDEVHIPGIYVDRIIQVQRSARHRVLCSSRHLCAGLWPPRVCPHSPNTCCFGGPARRTRVIWRSGASFTRCWSRRIRQGGKYEKFIERLTLAGEDTAGASLTQDRERIARRAALELSDGDYVNLGSASRGDRRPRRCRVVPLAPPQRFAPHEPLRRNPLRRHANRPVTRVTSAVARARACGGGSRHAHARLQLRARWRPVHAAVGERHARRGSLSEPRRRGRRPRERWQADHH